MKKIIFIAHDPGGSDVIAPVYKEFPMDNYDKVFWTTGSAGDKYPTYKKDKDDALQSLKTYLQNGEIKCLVTGTSWGDDTEIRAIAMCKDFKVFTISVLDYWSNYSQRFYLGDGITHTNDGEGGYVYPDAYFVMDELAKTEAIADGVPENIVKIVGHPGLDKYILKGKSYRNDHELKNRILFLSQPLSVLYGKSLGFTEYDAMEDVKSICKKLKLPLALKFHPKDSLKFRERYKHLSIEGDTDEAILKSKVVVGMNTMALLHAALMGVPIISYQPNLLQKDMCITNRMGIGNACFTKEELSEALLNIKELGELNEDRLFYRFRVSTKNVVKAIIDEIEEL